MASSIFQLFHRHREDLWHSKALGFFALKLLLATVRVPKGETRGSIVQKKPLFQISVWTVWRGMWGQSARSAEGTHPSHCFYPAIALMRHWSDIALACLGTVVCAHCSVCFVCLLSRWMEIKAFVDTLLHPPQSEKVPVPTAVCAFAIHPHHDGYHPLIEKQQEILGLFWCLT